MAESRWRKNSSCSKEQPAQQSAREIELEHFIEELQSKLERMEKFKLMQEIENQMLEAKVQNLETELGLAQKMSEPEGQVAFLLDRIAKLQSSESDLKGQIRAQDNALNQEFKEASKLQDRAEELEGKVNFLEKCLQDRKKHEKELIDEVDEVKKDRKLVQSQFHEASSAKRRLEQQLQHLLSRKQDEEMDKDDKLEAKIHSLENELIQSRTREKELTKQIKELKGDLESHVADLQGELNRLQEKYNTEMQRFQRRESEMAAKQGELVQLQEKYNNEVKRFQREESEMAAKQSELVQLQEKYNNEVKRFQRKESEMAAKQDELIQLQEKYNNEVKRFPREESEMAAKQDELIQLQEKYKNKLKNYRKRESEMDAKHKDEVNKLRNELMLAKIGASHGLKKSSSLDDMLRENTQVLIQLNNNEYYPETLPQPIAISPKIVVEDVQPSTIHPERPHELPIETEKHDEDTLSPTSGKVSRTNSMKALFENVFKTSPDADEQVMKLRRERQEQDEAERTAEAEKQGNDGNVKNLADAKGFHRVRAALPHDAKRVAELRQKYNERKKKEDCEEEMTDEVFSSNKEDIPLDFPPQKVRQEQKHRQNYAQDLIAEVCRQHFDMENGHEEEKVENQSQENITEGQELIGRLEAAVEKLKDTSDKVVVTRRQQFDENSMKDAQRGVRSERPMSASLSVIKREETTGSLRARFEAIATENAENATNIEEIRRKRREREDAERAAEEKLRRH